MDDTILFRAALLSSVLGIAALLFLSQGMTIEEKESNGTEQYAVGRTVKVTGVVSSAIDNGKVMTIEVIQPRTTEVVVFKDGNLTIAPGTSVQVIGRIDEFNGREQLIADEITVVKE